MNYFKHRYTTFVQLMKEALTARRVKGPALKKAAAAKAEDDDQQIKVFSLKPSGQIKSMSDLTPEE